ncbi:MAG: hypothetical protein L0Z50_03840, partial [Verrucomicrobiales bacterium]|nr:hypothetical protein [Verrucomicrobiales bacterium]
HAGLWDSPTAVGEGTRVEYGNPFDVMGYSGSFPAGHFSANFKYQLGWLSAANIDTSSGEGRFRIYAMDSGTPLSADRRYALRIRRGIPVLDLSLDYWVDYRLALAANGLGSDGAIVQWGLMKVRETPVF